MDLKFYHRFKFFVVASCWSIALFVECLCEFKFKFEFICLEFELGLDLERKRISKGENERNPNPVSPPVPKARSSWLPPSAQPAGHSSPASKPVAQTPR